MGEEREVTDVDLSLYPMSVLYCGVCSLPLEYCSFGNSKKECAEWAAEHAPMTGEEDEGEIGDGLGSKMKAASLAEGDAAPQKTPSSSSATSKKNRGKGGAVEQLVKIARIARNKRKSVTVVGGLSTFPDVRMKEAAKKLGKHFACGSSVSKTASGAEEIVIQGDVLHELPPFLQDAFGVPLSKIVVLGE
jgi:density-regulated protein DRP1